jgi:hypothetical protein
MMEARVGDVVPANGGGKKSATLDHMIVPRRRLNVPVFAWFLFNG